MGLRASVLREQLRRIFRLVAAGAESPETVLDALSDKALDAQHSGKTTISMGHQEGSLGFATFAGWAPSAILELVDICRYYLDTYPADDYDTPAERLTAILASIAPTVFTRPDFRTLS